MEAISSSFTRRAFLKSAGAMTCIAAAGSLAACAPRGVISSSTVDSSERNMVPGDYTATARGHNSEFEVTVRVSEDAIEDISVANCEESHFTGTYPMEVLCNTILEQQTPRVDTVTGATFLSMAFIGAVTEALEQAGASESDFPLYEKPSATWEDTQTDVVVVGAGSGGLAATMQAYDDGLDVILVEQLGTIGGSSSARAGYYVGGGTKVAKQAGDMYTVEEFTALLKETNPEDQEQAEIYGANAGLAIDWLYDMGLTDMYYDVDGVYGRGTHWGDYGHIGGYMAETLNRQLEDRKIDVRFDTRVVELLRDGDRVCGVRAECDGQQYDIKAGAVILATGGYARNKELVEKHTPEIAGYAADSGTGCTGEGMLMAERAGAALDNMSDVFSYYGQNVLYNGVPRNLTYPVLSTGFIVVNEAGERFCNELDYYLRETVDAYNQLPGRHGFAIITPEQLEGVVRPALDYSANLASFYTKCENLEAAAKQFGIDEAGLKATVERYNGFVDAKVDEDFGKMDFALTQKIGDGPVYVAETQPSVHMTYGGVRTDADLHALTATNEIIPGLYVVGECRHVMLASIGTNTISLVDGRRAIEQIQRDELV